MRSRRRSTGAVDDAAGEHVGESLGNHDALRVSDNAELVALRDRGVLVADTAQAVSGATSGGQVQLLAGTTTDFIHPDSDGSAILREVIKPVLARAVGV